MSRISYVNGRYVPHAEASVHIEDRGYQLSDGVYEVMAFYNRRYLDADLHLARLARSLRELRIAPPMSDAALRVVIDELLDRNTRENGIVYLQVSRGVARRDHPFPVDTKPALVAVIAPIRPPKPADIQKGARAITAPDIRWGRRDIKSISLLPNVLAKQAAVEAGAKEAWLVDGRGVVTEGSSTNTYIVTKKGEIITHPLGPEILGGVTRDVTLRLARALQMKVIEKPFSLRDVENAAEAFLTSSSQNVLPVVELDGRKIGSGKPGPVALRLLDAYHDHIEKQTGYRV